MKANKQQKQVSVRMNEQIRASLIEDILSHRHGKDIRKLNKKFSTLADVIYHYVLDARIPEHKEVFINLPKGMTNISCSIAIKYPADVGSSYTMYANVYFGNQLKHLGHVWYKDHSHKDSMRAIANVLAAAGMLSKSRNVPHFSRSEIPEGTLTKRIRCLVNERTELWEKMLSDAKELRAVLYSFTTLKKLEENWPEIQAFTAKHRVYVGEETPKKPKAKAQLPAIPYAKLNDQFWLPSEKAAKEAAA